VATTKVYLNPLLASCDNYGVGEPRLWCERVIVMVSKCNGYGAGATHACDPGATHACDLIE
jgi:hypothetical protein